MERVPLSKLWWDETTGLYLWNGVPFTGVAYAGRRGEIESETEYRDGLRSGSHREWFLGGNKLAEGTFRDGTIHGTYREWHKNGQPAVEQISEHGITISEKRWDESGRLVKEYVIEEGGEDWQDLQEYRELFGK